ncbi:MAG TPA: hypothetical protein PLN85_02450 [archaeon]|mgnify:CR=1 FL=1|nr:hypothetical protein [archaeon]
MKSEKAQIMIFDILVTLVLVFLIIEIEQTYIFDYKTKIVSSESSLYFLEKNLVVDQLISDCNFLAKYDFISKVCYKNNIQLNSLPKIVFLDPSICKVVLDDEVVYNTQSTIVKTSFTRGVIYDGSFCVLEVDFCE